MGAGSHSSATGRSAPVSARVPWSSTTRPRRGDSRRATSAFPDPSAMRTIASGVEGQNYQIQSVVWNEQGMRAAATAMSSPAWA